MTIFYSFMIVQETDQKKKNGNVKAMSKIGLRERKVGVGFGRILVVQ